MPSETNASPLRLNRVSPSLCRVVLDNLVVALERRDDLSDLQNELLNPSR